MKLIRKFFACISFIFCGVCLPAHAQIPVTDVLSLVQQVQQVLAWVEQIESMKNQIENQRTLYNSLNGSRGLGNLLNDSSLRDTLPTNWQQVYADIRAGGYKGLTGPAKAIRDENKVYECPSTLEDAALKACYQEMNKTSQDKAFADAAYSSSQKRLNNIQSLMSQINASSDQKTILDLQARIQSENAMIQNEQTKLNMFKMMADADDKLIQQKKHEQDLAIVSRTGKSASTLNPVKFR